MGVPLYNLLSVHNKEGSHLALNDNSSEIQETNRKIQNRGTAGDRVKGEAIILV